MGLAVLWYWVRRGADGAGCAGYWVRRGADGAGCAGYWVRRGADGAGCAVVLGKKRCRWGWLCWGIG